MDKQEIVSTYASQIHTLNISELSIKQILYYQELGIKNNLQWVR